VLLFHNEEIESEHLTVPHPRMFERRFVLEPLLELVPGIRDPLTKKPLREFLKQVLDQEIRKL
jgi:2-amino-4-hydroxy-6-hydroxymethyldihydropteridine diphosphokinase